jgi:hypothetical protein
MMRARYARISRRRRPRLEVLEERTLLAAFTVTSVADSPGSLRQAITDADAAGAGTINFNIPGAGVHTIVAMSALPDVTVPVTIDGLALVRQRGHPGRRAGAGIGRGLGRFFMDTQGKSQRSSSRTTGAGLSR